MYILSFCSIHDLVISHQVVGHPVSAYAPVSVAAVAVLLLLLLLLLMAALVKLRRTWKKRFRIRKRSLYSGESLFFVFSGVTRCGKQLPTKPGNPISIQAPPKPQNLGPGGAAATAQTEF